jgi:2-amino-4-hydroxy-6-hydroxymethyldihydropteridine diphosphokinase
LPLFRKLKRIEEKMGRSSQAITPNRPIDLDLLLYGDLLLETEALSIPHPRLHERRFVLEPLSELAPVLVHPRLGKTMEALLKDLSDPHQARRVGEVLRGSF